jgi:hypothetical protein
MASIACMASRRKMFDWSSLYQRYTKAPGPFVIVYISVDYMGHDAERAYLFATGSQGGYKEFDCLCDVQR